MQASYVVSLGINQLNESLNQVQFMAVANRYNFGVEIEHGILIANVILIFCSSNPENNEDKLNNVATYNVSLEAELDFRLSG